MQNAVHALGWMLIHFLWQGCAIAACYWLACRLARPYNAQIKYWVGLGAYLAAAIAPLVTLMMHLRPQGVGQATAAVALPPITVVTGYPLSAGRVLQDALEPALPIVVVLWAIGVAMLSSRTFVGWLGTRRLLRLGVKPVSEEIRQTVLDMQRRLGISRTVRVLRSLRVQVPTVIGWLKPVILLPTSVITRIPREQLQMIIAHELAHVRRNDYLVNLLQLVIETLFFYHPSIRWLSRQVRQEREHCCDDLVVARCGRPVEYARALASLEVLREVPPAPALAATGGDLLSRVSRIVRREMPRAHSGHIQLALALGVAAVASLGAHQGLELRRSLGQQAPASVAPSEAPQAVRGGLPGTALGSGLRLHAQQEREAQQRREAERMLELARISQRAQRAASEARSEPVSPGAAPPAPEPLPAAHLEPGSDRAVAEGAAATPADPRFASSLPLEVELLDLMLARAEAAPALAAESEPQQAARLAITPVYSELPDYPYLAHRKGVEGFVRLQFKVSPRGRVRQVRVVDADPPNVFEEAAVKALKQWEFAIHADHDPDQKLYQTFDFALQDHAPQEPERSRRCNRTGSNICGQYYSSEHVVEFSPKDSE